METTAQIVLAIIAVIASFIQGRRFERYVLDEEAQLFINDMLEAEIDEKLAYAKKDEE